MPTDDDRGAHDGTDTSALPSGTGVAPTPHATDAAGRVRVDVRLPPGRWARQLAEETRLGLRARPPSIPPVWFYDEHGSHLFERITRLETYYPTRTEHDLLRRHASEIARRSAADTLVELGAGTAEKTRVLLDALADAGRLRRFIPLDVSESTLRTTALAVASEHTGIAVDVVVGDFRRDLDALPRGGRRLVAFLGSTIGNLDPSQRRTFLERLAATLDTGDSVLLGTDLRKDPGRLRAAYDDPEGVTAAFNRNALEVLNRELGADFDPTAFDHHAPYLPEQSWVEMRLVARRPQHVTITGLDDLEVRFAAGDWLRTEISTKFTTTGVVDDLHRCGLTVQRQWSDPADDYLLTLAGPRR